MKKLVVVNIEFRDVYTKKVHKVGERLEISEQRVSEITGVSPDLISVIGTVEEPADAGAESKDEAKKGESK